MKNNIYKRFEITVSDFDVDPVEEMVLEAVADKMNINFVLSESGRIITIDNVESITDVIKYLAAVGFEDDIGLIKEITEYWPDYTDILVTNDK